MKTTLRLVDDRSRAKVRERRYMYHPSRRLAICFVPSFSLCWLLLASTKPNAHSRDIGATSGSWKHGPSHRIVCQRNFPFLVKNRKGNTTAKVAAAPVCGFT
jgi:hypothetical protein